MQDDQDDIYAPRRAALEAQFQALPSVGSGNYWRRIEEPDAAQRLPLEVLARCCRERTAAGALTDAERIMKVIWRQVQPKARAWAWGVAKQGRSGMAAQLQQDLEEECLVQLWQELAGDGSADNDPSYLLTNFTTGFLRLRQHVAHDVMERAAEWQRDGVKQATRIPRGAVASLQAEPTGGEKLPFAERLGDPGAQEALEQVELSDLLATVKNLPDDQRVVILDRFWEGMTQQETAAKLGISTRMVRYLLSKALSELRMRYGGGEEGKSV